MLLRRCARGIYIIIHVVALVICYERLIIGETAAVYVYIVYRMYL